MRRLVRVGKNPRLRFIADVDWQRLLHMALNRTGLPVQYSQGFNPHQMCIRDSIQVDEKGENCILLHGGSNLSVTRAQIESVISAFDAGDCIVLKNEVNMLPEIVRRARAQGMKIVLNPSPVEGIRASVPMNMIE